MVCISPPRRAFRAGVLHGWMGEKRHQGLGPPITISGVKVGGTKNDERRVRRGL